MSARHLWCHLSLGKTVVWDRQNPVLGQPPHLMSMTILTRGFKLCYRTLNVYNSVKQLTLLPHQRITKSQLAFDYIHCCLFSLCISDSANKQLDWNLHTLKDNVMLWDPACENMDWIYLSDPGDKPGQSRLINVQLACSIEIIYMINWMIALIPNVWG